MQNDLFGGRQKLPLNNAEVMHHSHWLQDPLATELLQNCLAKLPWEQPELKVAGKYHKIPRRQCWVGDEKAVYHYSNTTFVPNPWPKFLISIKLLIEIEAQVEFNSVLVNHYRDGADGMGFHSDDEPELGANPTVVSLSLGGTRRFVFKPRSPGESSVGIQLQHGDLLIMAGVTQSHWLHGVPKTQKPCSPRVNLTFRNIIVNR